MRRYKILWSMAFVSLAFACVRRAMPRDELSDIVGHACNGVCEAGPVTQGGHAPSVLVFEERHTSRLGRIEMAMAMARLYYTDHLRDLGLEGYLADRREFDVSWARPLRARYPRDFESVVVRLLQEGEINATEFMALFYDDVVVHPLEQSSERRVAPPDPIPSLLYRIAERSLTDEQAGKVAAIIKRSQTLDPAHREAKMQEARNILEAATPWAKSRLEQYTAVHSLEDELGLLGEVEQRVAERGVPLDARERDGIAQHREFLEMREHASTTMAQATDEMARHAGAKLVAIEVGSAHTNKIVAQLHCQAIAITPRALVSNDRTGDLVEDQFDRKMKKQSVYGDEIAQLLALAQNPEPVVAEPWLQAKIELYLAVHQIATAALGGPGPPPPPRGPPASPSTPVLPSPSSSSSGGPPFGFDGKWIRVIPASIEQREEGKQAVVIFKAEVTGSDGRRAEVWAKAALMKNEPVPTEERERVEKMLRDAFEAVAAEQETASGSGRIRLTNRIVVVLAKTKAEAVAIPLRA